MLSAGRRTQLCNAVRAVSQRYRCPHPSLTATIPFAEALLTRSRKFTTVALPTGRAEAESKVPRSQVPKRLPPSSTSVFEDLTEEYARQSRADVKYELRRNEGRHPNHILARLIEKGDFEGARFAKQELLRSGVSLRKSKAYVEAALHSLERRSKAGHDRLFLEWWALLPGKAMEPHLASVAASLMQQPFQLDLLREFALLSAKAGYADEMERQALPFILKYSNLDTTTQFIQSFQECASIFARTKLLNRAAQLNYKSGRRDEGLQLLQQIREEGLEVQRETDEAIAHHHAVHSKAPAILPSVPSERARITPSPSTMAEYMRLLRNAIKNEYRGSLVNLASYFIMTYEDRYNRTRAVDMLRKRIFDLGSPRVQQAWIAGEQLSFSKREMPLAVIRSFLHYNLPSHVPVASFRTTLEKEEERVRRTGARAKTDNEHSKSTLVPIKSKLWPDVASLSAVWKAVIQLSTSRKELDDLYAAMITPIKQLQTDEAQEAPSVMKSTGLVIPSSELPGAGIFHHFIVAYATRYGGKRGADILADMAAFGVKQSIENWGALVGIYARSGDTERVDSILSYLVTSFQGSSTSKEIDEPTFKANIIAAHNSVMRGYTECALYDEARKIQQRMTELGFFESVGVNERTRAILRRLRRSEKGGYSERLSRKRFKVRVGEQEVHADPYRADWVSGRDDVEVVRNSPFLRSPIAPSRA